MADTRDCYREAARSAAAGQLSCCAPCAPHLFGAAAYPRHELASLPRGLVESAMGCGHPVAAADIRPGDIVLDLGCGTGLDAVLAARRTGATGKVIGIDRTEGLIALACDYAWQAGANMAEFRVGAIENLPLPKDCADVAISNSTVSLSEDKPATFAEAHRVLRPGGRLVLTDFILRDGLDTEQRAQAGRDAGCLTGTLSASEYAEHLTRAGFGPAEIRIGNRIAAGMYLGLITAANRAVPR